MDECERAASPHLGRDKARLHAHPRLTRVVLLWHGTERWKPRRATIRREVRARLTAAGEAQRDSASGRGDYAELLCGLDLLEWRDLRHVIATNAYVAQSLFRLKANRFPLWNRVAENLSCLQHIDDENRDPLASQAVAGATLRRVPLRLRAIAAQPRLRGHPASADEMTSALVGSFLAHAEDPTLLPAHPQYTHTSIYLLFFDGGSRGNPGPGGSGSVIVRLSPTEHRTSVVWAASMAYGDRRTDGPPTTWPNTEVCCMDSGTHGLTLLRVVGDSAIIINQQRHRRPPISAKLRPLFMQTHALADEIGVTSWTHHYREYNKMTDKAANVAMDEKRSQQTWTPSDRDLMRSVERHTASDVSHWLDAAAEQPRKATLAPGRRHRTPRDAARVRRDREQQHRVWSALNRPSTCMYTAE